jgi:hypothetical protein
MMTVYSPAPAASAGRLFPAILIRAGTNGIGRPGKRMCQ